MGETPFAISRAKISSWQRCTGLHSDCRYGYGLDPLFCKWQAHGGCRQAYSSPGAMICFCRTHCSFQSGLCFFVYMFLWILLHCHFREGHAFTIASCQPLGPCEFIPGRRQLCCVCLLGQTRSTPCATSRSNMQRSLRVLSSLRWAIKLLDIELGWPAQGLFLLRG